MPRVPCNDCGIDVVVDPTGRCPEGHVVVEDAPRARLRGARQASRQTPWAADPNAPPRATDLLREIHSLHVDDVVPPDPAQQRRQSSARAGGDADPSEDAPPASFEPGPPTQPPPSSGAEHDLPAPPSPGVAPGSDQPTGDLHGREATELDLQLTELEAVMDAAAEPEHDTPPPSAPSPVQPYDASVQPYDAAAPTAPRRSADDELDPWDEEWITPQRPSGADGPPSSSTPPPPIPPPGANAAAGPAGTEADAPLWGPRAAQHRTEAPSPLNAGGSTPHDRPATDTAPATPPAEPAYSDAPEPTAPAPDRPSPSQRESAPDTQSGTDRSSRPDDGPVGPPVDALQGFTARGKPVGGRRRRQRRD